MEGRVRVTDLDTRSVPPAELAQKVGVVFQDSEAQFVMTTVEDEIAFGLENILVPPEEIDARIDEALSRVGMREQRRERLDGLSGGSKQRIALASLLALRPKVLVFDEPTANLDPAGTREFFGTIETLKRAGGHTIVLIEHKLDALMPLIDRVVVLDSDGIILVEGPPREIFRDHTLDLIERGIWIPQVSLLAHRLRDRGTDLDPLPVTLDEAVRALEKFVPKTLESQKTNGHRSRSDAPGCRTTAIEVRDLSFSYDERRVLDSVSLSVTQGDFLAIVGANGAGKTTLGQHLMGILRPPRGVVMFEGRDVTRIPDRELIQQIGYVFQNPEHQFVTGSVEREIGFGLQLLGLADEEISRRVSAVLERFGLSRYAKANPFTLSGGEKRRLSVATMLAVGQQILILDEPTFGQDQSNAEKLLLLLRGLHAEGRTIVTITHDMSLVAEHARNVVVLSEGKLLYHGPKKDLFTRPELLEVARLEPPPLAELSQRLKAKEPGWKDLLTLDHFLEVCEKTSKGEVQRVEHL